MLNNTSVMKWSIVLKILKLLKVLKMLSVRNGMTRCWMYL